MKPKTRKLLRLCKEAGYKRVCIGVAHRSVPQTATHGAYYLNKQGEWVQSLAI